MQFKKHFFYNRGLSLGSLIIKNWTSFIYSSMSFLIHSVKWVGMNETTQPLEQLKQIRIEKLEKLKKLGVNPFVSKGTLDSIDIKEARAKKVDDTVAVHGRIRSLRSFGKLTFLKLEDYTGVIQLAIKGGLSELDQKVFELLDIGDFIEVEGKLFLTKTEELTIHVEKLGLLTKSIRPLPSEHFGLKDEEEKFRQRYVDLILNSGLRDLFVKKARFWNTIRSFMIEKGFLEVETPVLENTAGGADADPFVTHHNALDIDVYLRISMGELWQKRLMVAGFDKTFEIGRQFRNEGMSREHLQDYTQMEFYWAYANYKDSMKLVEEMYKRIAKDVFGTMEFKIGEHNVNFDTKWEIIDYRTIIQEKMNINIEVATEGKLRNKLDELHVKYEKEAGKGRLIDYLWKQIRKGISGPAFLVGHPVEVSPLAKRIDGTNYTERYQIILAGSEMGNGYSELNDPIDQAKRFAEQQKLRDSGDAEAQMEDNDFVRALEYGMPPVTGFGVSERLFSFLANKSVRECVLFPLLKPE